MQKSKPEWKFSTTKDDLRIAGVSLLSIALPLGALSFVVAPPLLAGAAVLSAALTGTAWWAGKKNFYEDTHVKLSPESKEGRLIEEISNVFKLKSAPAIYFEKPQGVFATLSDGAPIEVREIYSEDSDYAFVSSLSENVILTNRRCLKKHPEPELCFIFGHEMAHLKMENNFFFLAATHFSKIFPEVLKLGIFGAAVFSAVAAGPSLAGALAFTAAYSSSWLAGKASGFCLMFAARAREFRADRNALYATGDLNAALNVLEGIRGEEKKLEKDMGRPMVVFQDHPHTEKRISRLQNAWKKVAECREAAGLPVKKPAVVALPARNM